MTDLPEKRGHAPKGITDKQRRAYGAEKQVEVWKLYVGGLTSFREIEERTGIPRATASRWIKGELKSLAADRQDLAENFLETELTRLDTMLEMAMEDFKVSVVTNVAYEGKRRIIETQVIDRIDVKVCELILKIQERRSKYLAFDAPKRDNKEDKNDFDLAELVQAAMLLQKGEMPKEFIEAQFTEENKDVKKEGDQEEASETSDKEEGGEKDVFTGNGEADIFVIEETGEGETVQGDLRTTEQGSEEAPGETLGFDESFFKD